MVQKKEELIIENCRPILILKFLLDMSSRQPITVREYVKRNIVGYDQWWSVDKDGRPTKSIYERGSWPSSSFQRGVAIRIALGGWGNSSAIEGDTNIAYVAKAHWRLSRYQPFLGHDAVKLCDNSGVCLTVNLDEAVVLINKFPEFCWSNVIWRLLFDMLTFGRALDVLVEAVDEIAATSRFVRSKEGARLREKLTSRALELLGHDDPRRPKLDAISSRFKEVRVR